jgi:cobalt-zinc-cadmium efflux system outer membrane protein
MRQDTAGAQADTAQADAELALAQQRVAQEATRARQALDVAQQQLTHAQERRALTADTLRLAEKAFALGESDLSTLLRARSAALDADAFFNRQHTARLAGVSRLNQSLGVMP